MNECPKREVYDEHGGVITPDRGHCAHPSGFTQTSNPPIHGVFCCWCGLSGSRSEQTLPMPGHGPFARPATSLSPVKWETP